MLSEMGNRMIQHIGLAVHEEQTNMRNVIWPFLQGSHFSLLGVQMTAMFHQVWQIRLLFTALQSQCNVPKHGKQGKHGVDPY